MDSSTIESEADALLTLKDATGAGLSSWSAADKEGVCSWEGVTCDAASAITELDLSGEGLIGDITVAITLPFLASLQKVDLSNNAVKGDLSSILSGLPDLKYLDLSNNKDTVFGSLNGLETVGTALEYVDISSNEDFKGDLGIFMADLIAAGTPLEVLDVSGTAVFGTIAAVPESLTYIQALNTAAEGDCASLDL